MISYSRDITRVCVIAVFLLAVMLSTEISAAKLNALMPSGNKQSFAISKDGTALVDIVLSSSANAQERLAAAELAKNLKLITDADFKVVKDDAPISGHYISVGNTRQAREVGFADIPAKLGKEGIAVKISGGNIYLLGGKVGIMNAVMAFLEQDAGCRWYSHKWRYIPHDKNLNLEVTDRISIPDFEKRFVFTASPMSSEDYWTKHNRVMKWNKFDHVDGWFCHTYDVICPMSEFKARPDLFAKQPNGKPFNTQLCPTHPEILKLAKEKALAALANNKHKEATLISISERDGSTGYCHCSRCEKINKQQGTPIAAHLTLVNEVARAIAKDYPDIKVDFLIYSRDFRTPPLDMKLEPNVAAWYCTTGTPFEQAYRTDPKGLERFKKWNKLVDTMYIWDYGCDFGNYFRVQPSLYAKADNLKLWKSHGVKGVMFLEVYGCVGGDQQALRAWVLSKMLWDASLDPDDLAKDFCQGAFGEAADEMYEYYKLVDAAGRAGKSVEKFYGETEFISKANDIFERAFAKAKKANNTQLVHRIEVHYLPVAIMEIDRIFGAYPGNKDNFPIERYNKLIDTVKSVTARENMQSYSELRTMAGRIQEWEMLSESAQSGKLRIYSVNGTLYEYPKRRDPLSSTGIASRLPCNDNWLVQWHIPVNLCSPGTKYQLRAQLRTEKPGGQGQVASVGVHFPKNPAKSHVWKIDAKSLTDKKYRWVMLGKPFTPQKDCYIWFAAAAGSKIGGLYIDQIELLPVNK